VALIIHVVKTGRNQIWIWVLALLVAAGTIALHRGGDSSELFAAARRSAPRAGLRKPWIPARPAPLRGARRVSPATSRAASGYAEELVRHERYDEAIAQYREALYGIV